MELNPKVACVDMAFRDAKEEAFSNVCLSHRGSIRRPVPPPNVVSWCSTLAKLKAKGEMDMAGVIKTWNKHATQGSRLVGAKAMSVKNLLELTEYRTLAVIADCVSKHGWENCPFTDGAFSSRKLFFWPTLALSRQQEMDRSIAGYRWLCL